MGLICRFFFWRNVFGWLWGVWGLVSGQVETCSDTKYDVSMAENHLHSRLISKAKNKQAEFKLKFECRCAWISERRI